jgi:hypothetical protein
LETCPDCIITAPPSKRMFLSLMGGIEETYEYLKMDLEVFLRDISSHEHLAKTEIFDIFFDPSESVIA